MSDNPRKRGPGQDGGERPNKQSKPDDVGLKFLLPNVVVGALLSRKAAALKRIKDQTCHEVELKLSGREQTYPGTLNERMIALRGNPPMVHRACCLLQDQIIDDPFLVTDEAGTTEHGPRQGQVKIVVSDRAASKIIGSRGAVIKDISSHFNIAINITPAKEVIVQEERVVTILGPSRNVYDALEPIIYQVSQQPSQVSPEFDYYDEINKNLTEEKKDSSEAEQDDDVKEEKNDGADIKEESDDTAAKEETDEDGNIVKTAEDEDKAEVAVEAEPTEESAEQKEETPKEEAPKEAEEPKKEASKDEPLKDEPQKEQSKGTPKKSNRVPKKDGRWMWQTDPKSNRPSWVWVDNKPQKNSNSNHSRHNSAQAPMNRRY